MQIAKSIKSSKSNGNIVFKDFDDKNFLIQVVESTSDGRIVFKGFIDESGRMTREWYDKQGKLKNKEVRDKNGIVI